jgi:hypothetical protein
MPNNNFLYYSSEYKSNKVNSYLFFLSIKSFFLRRIYNPFYSLHGCIYAFFIIHTYSWAHEIYVIKDWKFREFILSQSCLMFIYSIYINLSTHLCITIISIYLSYSFYLQMYIIQPIYLSSRLSIY